MQCDASNTWKKVYWIMRIVIHGRNQKVSHTNVTWGTSKISYDVWYWYEWMPLKCDAGMNAFKG